MAEGGHSHPLYLRTPKQPTCTNYPFCHAINPLNQLNCTSIPKKHPSTTSCSPAAPLKNKGRVATALWASTNLCRSPHVLLCTYNRLMVTDGRLLSSLEFVMLWHLDSLYFWTFLHLLRPLLPQGLLRCFSSFVIKYRLQNYAYWTLSKPLQWVFDQ